MNGFVFSRYNKVVSFFLVVIIIMLALSYKINAVDTIDLEMDSVSGSKGSDVILTISIKNVPSSGINSGDFFVEYDIRKFKYVSFEAGSIINNKESDIAVAEFNQVYADFDDVKSTGLNIVYVDYDMTGTSHIKEDGVFCKLKLHIEKSCPDGEYDIKIRKKVAQEANGNTAGFYDASSLDDYQYVEANYKSGSVIVSSNTSVTASSTASATETPRPSATVTPTSSAEGTSTSTSATAKVNNSTPIPTVSAKTKSTNNKHKTIMTFKIDDPYCYTSDVLKEIINSQNLKETPKVISDIPMLPIEKVIELMKGNIQTVEINSKYKIEVNNRTSYIWIQSDKIEINGKMYSLKVNTTQVDGVLYVPANFLAICTGYIVEWDFLNKEYLKIIQ